MTTQQHILDDIRAHGEAAYPQECCGFLLGAASGGGNRVLALWKTENRHGDDRRRRYHITPADYREADRAARQRKLDVVGFYHSHPDHPARPSPTDLAEATFPGYTYVIVSIQRGQAAELTAWSLAPDRSRFEPEDVCLATRTAAV